MKFVAADTEDNSEWLARTKRDLFDKKITQICALTHGLSGERFYNTGDAKEFLIWLAQLADKDTEPLRCYFHNLQYDLGNLFGESLDELDIKLVKGRFISARWKNILFLDSFNIWSMALKKLGKAIGLEKLKFSAKSKKYVTRDTEIVLLSIKKAHEFARSYGVHALPSTLGGLGVAIWKELGGTNIQIPDKRARTAYIGARTELFARGFVTYDFVSKKDKRFFKKVISDEMQLEKGDEIIYSDINSLYPYCMTLLYPDDYYDISHRCEERWRGVLKQSPLWGVAEVTIEVPEMPITPLPVRAEDGSIYFPFGELTGYWTIAEIDSAVKAGAHVTKISWAMGSETASACYKVFVYDVYDKRKAETDPGKSLFYKLLMNTLYGQLGMDGIISRSLILNKFIARDKKGKPLLSPDGKIYLTKEGVPYGTKLLCDIEMPLPEHVNYVHVAHVTSYGRLTLLDFIRKIDHKDLIYCDTDSLIFVKRKGKPLPFQFSNELGEMKLVKRLKAVFSFGQKLYAVCDEEGNIEWKAKGIPVKKAKKFITTGKAQFVIPYKLRESIACFDDAMEELDKKTLARLSIWHSVLKKRQKEYWKKEIVGNYYWPKKHVDEKDVEAHK